MKYTILLYFLFLGSIAFSQNRDSATFIMHLSSVDLNNTKSIETYGKALLNPQVPLSDSLTIRFLKRALNAAQQINNDTLSSFYAMQLSQRHRIINFKIDAPVTLKYAEVSLKHAEQSGQKKYLTEAQLTLGSYHYAISEFSKAIEYYLLALINLSSPKDYLSLSSIYLNIGNCYWQLGDLRSATKYAKISILNSEKLLVPDQTEGLVYGYLSLQSYYKQLSQTDSVEVYLEKAIQYGEQLKPINEEGRYSYILGDVSMQAAKFYLSQNEIEKASYFLEDPSVKTYFPGYYKALSIDYAVKNNDLKTASELVNNLKPDLLDKNDNQYNANILFYSVLANYYEKIGKNNLSLENYKKMNDVEITRLKADKVKFTTYTDAKIEAIQQKDRVNFLEQQQGLEQNRYNWLMTAVFLMALFLSLALYTISQMRTKNQLLHENLKGQQVIKEQARQLQLINQQKSAFFVNIAHELQTPLHLIRGLAKQIQKTQKDNSLQNEQVEIIIGNSNKLVKATEQILDLSKAEEKPLKVYPKLFYLKDLIDNISQEYEILAKNKNINFTIFYVKEMSYPIYTDLKKLRTIIENLISNAIKYTASGGRVHLEYIDLAEKSILINLKDTGRGIVQEDLNSVFTQYYQSAKLKPEGGVGIGLAICKLYTNLLNGSISVESTVGIGSTFSLQIPQFLETPLPETEIFRFSTSNPSNAKPTVAIGNTFTEKKTILIVEDNLDFCKYLQMVLQDDYEILTVYNGTEALSSLEKKISNLIITDWMMPEIDGLELVKLLKDHQKYQHIPVMMLTARNIFSDKLKALKIGVDDYMLKQFEEEHLKSRLVDLLKRADEKNTQISLRDKDEMLPIEDSKKADTTLRKEDWLMKLEKYIYSQIGNFDLKAEIIAEEMQISTRQLNRKVKELTGLTTMKYIQEVRFWEARRMLEIREYESVKAVVFSVGYKDQQNFSKIFKERFGKTPSEYL